MRRQVGDQRLLVVPNNRTCCGLAPPLSVMVINPSKVPASIPHFTVMVQDFPAATLDPQLLVPEKAEPVIVMPLIASVVLPTFVRVTVSGGGGQFLPVEQ